LPDDRKSNFFYGYVIVLAAILILLIVVGAYYSFGVFFKPVLTEFGWTRAMTSLAYSLSMFLTGSFAIVMGRLNDRFGPRLVTVVSGLLMGLGFLLMSQISAIWQLYLFLGVIIGVGRAGNLTPLISTVTRWFVKRRGLMTGIAISGIGLGTTIVPPIAAWLISSYGWRDSYLIVGGALLVIVTLAAQFLKLNPAQMGQLPYGVGEIKTEGSNLEATGFSFREALRTRQLWLLFAMFLCFGAGEHSILVHIAPHTTDLGFSAIDAANTLAIIGALSIAGRIMMGGAADRISNKLVLTISFILASVSLFWLLAANELWMLYLFAAVFGFAYGGLMTLMSPMVAELFGLKSHGSIYGTVLFGMTVGAAFGPPLAGHIFDIADSYHLAFIIFAVLSTIGLMLTSFLKPTGIKTHG